MIKYAIRKGNLLLDMGKNISIQTLVILIAARLPKFIRNRIDKEKWEKTTGLLHEIRKCENLAKKNNFIKKKEDKQENKKKFEENKPCRICEKLNKRSRYQENSCWFKKKDDNQSRTSGNNAVLEVA